jgi:CBS domain-containing protein
MTLRAVTAALVATDKGDIIGIVTDRDLRARVLAEKTPLSAPVHSVMSSPLAKISEKALIYEALMRMEEKGVQHLAIEDTSGQIVSVIDHKSLIQFHRYGPIVVSREIARAQNPAEIARSCERIPSLLKTLLDSSARPRPVTNMLATTCDDATRRLIELAIAELGPAPAAFAFIAMGSQGRQEQTLLTDQDNGIIFAPPAQTQAEAANAYFQKLGTFVCEGLNLAGYSYCKGKVMAMNARWCRSLPDWITTMQQWLSRAEPQEIIDLNVFFDLRTVFGEAELTRTLRRAIHTALEGHPSFYHHFAHSALAFKPPFRLLGNFYLSGGATEHAGEINLKDAMMPLVTFARLYALKHGITATNTLERLEAMCAKNLILPASKDEFVVAYDFLMHLRLHNQLTAIQSGRPALNIIHPGRLGYTQQELLKQAFAQIAAVQKKIGYDFLGGEG